MSIPVVINVTEVRFLKLQDVHGRSVNDVLAILKQKGNTLVVQTPAIRYRLHRKDKPLKKQPELAKQLKGKFPLPPPPFHLAVVSPLEAQSMKIFVKIRTSAQVDLPIITVNFREKPKNVGEIITNIQSTFTFATTAQSKLFFKELELTSETSLKSLMKSLKKSTECHLTFECELTKEALMKIETREMPCQELISTEQIYLMNLDVLDHFWKDEFLKNRILESKKWTSRLR
jgi:hypothetical protein